jgi:ATP-binding cassette, subfamily B, bacterial
MFRFFIKLRASRRRGAFKALAQYSYWSPILLLAFVVMLGYLVSSLCLPYFIGRFIDVLAHGRSHREMVYLSLLIGSSGVAFASLFPLYNLLVFRWGVGCQARLSSHLLTHILKLPMPFFDSTSSGRLVSMLTNDCTTAATLYKYILGKLVLAGFNLLLILTVVRVLFPSWLLLAILLFPVYLSLPLLSKRAIHAATHPLQEQKARVSECLQELLKGIADIKAYQLESWASERSTKEFFAAARLEYEQVKTLQVWDLGSAIHWSILGILYFLLGRKVLASQLTVGQLVAVISYFAMLGGPARLIVNLSESAHTSLAAFERVVTALNEEPEKALRAGINGIRKCREMGILFERVSFGYPGSPTAILQNITIHIPFGKRIGLVGPSGSGKTTLIRLILRLYDASSGQIFIDGQTIESYDLTRLRKKVGVLHQEPTLFDVPIFENIQLGCLHAQSEDVKRAAGQAQANRFIEAMSRRYSTMSGEGGAKLSVGQRRRVAVARLLLKNSEVCILDEPLSGLDAASARQVRNELVEFLKGRTTLFISHYLPDVTDCDVIIVLDQGLVVGQGTHERLLTTCAMYAGLYDIQLRSRRAEMSEYSLVSE